MRAKITAITVRLKYEIKSYFQILFIWLFYILNKKIILCVGDSHAEAFDNKYLKLENTKSYYYSVNGATAVGILNPNSATDARKKILRYLKLVPQDINLVLSFGEVDCGFLIWYRKQNNNENVEMQFEKTFKNYSKFIVKISKNFKNLFIYNVPIPTLKEYDKKIYKWSLRKDINATLKQRTWLTTKFNKWLKNYCNINNYTFIELGNLVIDKNTGMVNKKFANKSLADHHYDYEELGPIVNYILKNYGFE